GQYADTQTFLVGAEATPLLLHYLVLQRRWPKFLQTNGFRYSADGRRSYDLTKQDHKTFEVLATWIYTGRIPASPNAEADIASQRLVKGVRLSSENPWHDKENIYPNWRDEDLVDLWLLACELDIPELADAAISSLFEQNVWFQHTTSLEAVNKAFANVQNVTKPTLLQKYLIDEAVYYLGDKHVPRKTD
ncbi:uncharacterized protein MYCFIDRAFT_215487, partial [Pseudocercospora fijiensis CIRAD86]